MLLCFPNPLQFPNRTGVSKLHRVLHLPGAAERLPPAEPNYGGNRPGPARAGRLRGHPDPAQGPVCGAGNALPFLGQPLRACPRPCAGSLGNLANPSAHKQCPLQPVQLQGLGLEGTPPRPLIGLESSLMWSGCLWCRGTGCLQGTKNCRSQRSEGPQSRSSSMPLTRGRTDPQTACLAPTATEHPAWGVQS